MASKASASTALLLSLNLLFFTLVTSHTTIPTGCSNNLLDLSLCVNVLDVLDLNIGSNGVNGCCSLIGNLVKLETDACVCAAIPVNILNLLILNVNLDVGAVLDLCKDKLPRDVHCA